MNEIRQLYDTIQMPQHLQNRILGGTTAPRRRFRPAAAVAAVMVFVCILGCSPTVRAAVDSWVSTTFPDLDLTIYEKKQEDGRTEQVVVIDTDTKTFAHVENGRLYFTGNGENLDITDQVTPQTPFFYTYEDQNHEITLVVAHDGDLENFGTYEFIKENGVWFTGTGRNFLSSVQEGVAYPWVKIVWDTLDVPWPMPGDQWKVKIR